MAFLNLKTITQAVKYLLIDDVYPRHGNLTIARNRMRNDNPNLAKGGWIGIYKGNNDFTINSVGANRWRAELQVLIEVQYAHGDFEQAEDGLHDLENDVLEVLTSLSNTTLDGTVSFTGGFSLDYEILSDEDASPYWHSSLITLSAEART